MNPDVAAQVLTNGDLRNSTIRRSLPSRKGKPANAPSGPVPATPEPVGLQTAVHKPRTDYKSELLQQLVTAGMVRDGSAAQLIERALLCR